MKLVEWIDAHGIEEAERHLNIIACVCKLSAKDVKRISFLHSYIQCVKRVYEEPTLHDSGKLGRRLACTYSQIRFGRFYCSTHKGPNKDSETFPRYICAQGMPSILRIYLLRKWVHDYDIQNCHVSLMYQMGATMHTWEEFGGKMLPLSLPMMKDLYECREEFIDDVANVHNIASDDESWPGYRKETVKQLLLRIMYGGNYDSWMEEQGIYGAKSKRVLRLQVELDRLRMAILNSERFKVIVDDETRAQSKKRVKTEAIHRGVFSKIAQHLECNALLAMYDFLQGNGFIVHSLIFDGLTVQHANKQPDTSEMEAYVKDATGMSIKIVEKPLYNPVQDLEITPLFQWITRRSPSKAEMEHMIFRAADMLEAEYKNVQR